MNMKSVIDVIQKSDPGNWIVEASLVPHFWVVASFFYGIGDLTDLRDDVHPTIRAYIVKKFFIRGFLFVVTLAGYCGLFYRGLYTFILALSSVLVIVPGIVLEDIMDFNLSWGQRELLLSACNESYGSAEGLSYYPSLRGNGTIDTPEVAAIWCYRQWRSDWAMEGLWVNLSIVPLSFLVYFSSLYLREIWLSTKEQTQKPEPKAPIDDLHKRLGIPDLTPVFGKQTYIANMVVLCKVLANYRNLAEVLDYPILSKHVDSMRYINALILAVGIWTNLMGLFLGPVFWVIHSFLFILVIIPGVAYTSISEMSLTWNNRELLLGVCADSQGKPSGLTYAMGLFGAQVAELENYDSEAGMVWCDGEWRYTWTLSLVTAVVCGLFMLVAFFRHGIYLSCFFTKIPILDGARAWGVPEENVGLVKRGYRELDEVDGIA